MRVELSEIETALSTLPQIAAAAISAPKDENGQTRLVAYLATDDNATQSAPDVLELAPLDAGEIRSELAKTLPEHMIPQSFARLSHLPLTPSGKLDRKALPEVAADLAQAEYVAPDGPMEELVAEEIGKLLGENVGSDTTPPDRIGRHDGFFALGGHSLLAVQLVNRLEAATGLTVPLRAIFDANDIAELAATIDGLLDGEMPGVEADVDDAHRDIMLVEKLPQAPKGAAPDLADAETILLTGVTGFLGRYLLRDLLNRTKAKIICVARGDDGESRSPWASFPSLTLGSPKTTLPAFRATWTSSCTMERKFIRSNPMPCFARPIRSAFSTFCASCPRDDRNPWSLCLRSASDADRGPLKRLSQHDPTSGPRYRRFKNRLLSEQRHRSGLYRIVRWNQICAERDVLLRDALD